MSFKSIFIYLELTMLATTIGCAQKGVPDDDYFPKQRLSMVKHQLQARDIVDPRVLKVMSEVPRHLFVPQEFRSSAYEDYPLPIGYDQTISQPYIVALMTQLLALKGDETVLEIGTGSGYQAAVLAELCSTVCSIEIIPQLADSSAQRLKDLGYDNVKVICADGYKGWPDKNLKFDGIIITAAPPRVPKSLLNQLQIGGRLVVPEGVFVQELRLYTRTEKGFEVENVLPVRFVPMIRQEKGK
jgi:protein-L-isoaspartate(D-aspartate) O-methyltransferase